MIQDIFKAVLDSRRTKEPSHCIHYRYHSFIAFRLLWAEDYLKKPEMYLKAVKMMIALSIHLMTFAGTYF